MKPTTIIYNEISAFHLISCDEAIASEWVKAFERRGILQYYTYYIDGTVIFYVHCEDVSLPAFVWLDQMLAYYENYKYQRLVECAKQQSRVEYHMSMATEYYHCTVYLNGQIDKYHWCA